MQYSPAVPASSTARETPRRIPAHRLKRMQMGTAVLSAGAWVIGRAVANPGALSLAGFDQDAQRYGDDLGILAGSGPGAAIRLLAASMRAAVPDAVTQGVKAPVNVALTTVAGPMAAVGAALAAATAGKMVDAVLSGTPQRASSVPHEPAQQESARLDLNPLRGSDMHRFVAQLAARLKVDDILRPRRVRVRSYQVDAARAEDQTEPSFLNSFYADDLARVARAFIADGVGRGLAAYLTSATRIDTGERTDVRVRPATVWNGCLPDRIPPGRWAANFDRSLVMSQQFAVNEIMERPGRSGGLLAVNGPPGTGKTTMLRDLVAAIVVARAEQLAKLPSPAAAFDGSKAYQWQPGREAHRITPLKQRVTGMEIVVASSNNGAVENITTEVPGSDGIGLPVAGCRPPARLLRYYRPAFCDGATISQTGPSSSLDHPALQLATLSRIDGRGPPFGQMRSSPQPARNCSWLHWPCTRPSSRRRQPGSSRT